MNNFLFRWENIDESDNALLGSYIPFIMGARNCIGSRFAMLEVRGKEKERREEKRREEKRREEKEGRKEGS